MIYFTGGSLCFYRLSTCAGSHEKREGQVKTKGEKCYFVPIKNICFLGISGIKQKITYYGLSNSMLTFAALKIVYNLLVTQIDMISLGTYLKRFNFKLHAKQVREQKDNNFVAKFMNHMCRKWEFMNVQECVDIP